MTVHVIRSISSDLLIGFPFKPEHIDTKGHFFNSFGHSQTEDSAGWIVRHCQEKGDWSPFPRAELDAKHQKEHGNNFRFNRLISGGYIVEEDGTCFITVEFILKCMISRPCLEGVSGIEKKEIRLN